MNRFTRLIRGLTAWAWADDLRRLRHAEAHVRSMQTMLAGSHETDQLHDEIARLTRLLRAMRDTNRRMRDRSGRANIHWPSIP